MSSLPRLVAALAIVLVSVLATGVASAQTDNSTADTAAPFTGNVDGQLAGGRAGHFAFYSFVYPGNRTTTLNLQASPNDQTILQYVGIKVFAPTGRLVTTATAQKGVTPSATT